MKIRFNQPEHKTPNIDRGVRIQYGDAKRANKPWRWYFILIISSIPLVYLVGLAVQELIVTRADGRISVPQITVRSSGDGNVQQIYVEPLQKVAEGEDLALLVDSVLENNYQRIKSEINFLGDEKNKLSFHERNPASDFSQLIAFAMEQKNFYYKRMRQYDSLFQQGAATQAEIATARSQYNGALENLFSHENAQHRNQGLQSEIRQIATRINQLTSEFEKIENQMLQLLIKSPGAGLVTEIFAQPKEFLARGQPLLEIIYPEKAYISAFIPPKYQDYAHVDQIVTVKFPNGESARAQITSIPGVTQKSSSEDVGLLESPRSVILARMQFIEPVKTQLINGIPVSIRFHFFAQ